MTPNELRAEADMVDSEEGTDCTTRACLLRGAADEIEKLKNQTLYEGVMPDLSRAARECGYSLFVNGSLRRDCDLIAVPWVKTCFTEDELLKRIVLAARLRFGVAEITIGPTHRPHGLTAYVILLTEGKYLDLKIVPSKGFPAGGNPIETVHPMYLVPEHHCQCYSCGAEISEYTWVTTLICQKCSKDSGAVSSLADKLAATEDVAESIKQQLSSAQAANKRLEDKNNWLHGALVRAESAADRLENRLALLGKLDAEAAKGWRDE